MSLALVHSPSDDGPLFEDDVDLEALYPTAIEAIKDELDRLSRAYYANVCSHDEQMARFDREILRLKERRDAVRAPIANRLTGIVERVEYLGQALRREEQAAGRKLTGRLVLPCGTVSITKTEGVDWPDEVPDDLLSTLRGIDPSLVRTTISRSGVNDAIKAAVLLVTEGKVLSPDGEVLFHLKEEGTVSVSLKV